MVIRYNDFVKALEKLLIADYNIDVYVRDGVTVVDYFHLNSWEDGIVDSWENGYLCSSSYREYTPKGTPKTVLKQVKIVCKYMNTLYKNRGLPGGKEAINFASETLSDFRNRAKAIYHAKYDLARPLNRRK